MTSTLKTDVIESKTTDGDLTIQGAGTGVPSLETGFKVGGTAGVPVSALRAGTDGELITWAADASATTVAVGTATHVLTSNGAGVAPTFQAAAGGGGLASVQVFTSSGTWTKPTDIGSVRVQLVGSGAHGNNTQFGGGAGGYSEKFIDVSAISSVTVTVGPAGTSGSTSSFGTHLSATGGYHSGSNKSGSSADHGGYGGVGSGGDLNIIGGGGARATTSMSASGGSSYFGGGSPGSATTTTAFLHSHVAYGAGGMGVYNGYTQGTNVTTGVVIVWEYE